MFICKYTGKTPVACLILRSKCAEDIIKNTQFKNMFHECKNQSLDLKYMSFYEKREINASKKKSRLIKNLDRLCQYGISWTKMENYVNFELESLAFLS